MPTREFHTVTEFQPALAGVEVILIDVTERDQQRPGGPDTQKEEYRGKKKRHTLKNTVISNAIKSILIRRSNLSGTSSWLSPDDKRIPARDSMV